MGTRVMPVYVWQGDKARLEEMRAGMRVALDRPVVMAEVIRALLAEHDAALEVQAP